MSIIFLLFAISTQAADLECRPNDCTTSFVKEICTESFIGLDAEKPVTIELKLVDGSSYKLSETHRKEYKKTNPIDNLETDLFMSVDPRFYKALQTTVLVTQGDDEVRFTRFSGNLGRSYDFHITTLHSYE